MILVPPLRHVPGFTVRFGGPPLDVADVALQGTVVVVELVTELDVVVPPPLVVLVVVELLVVVVVPEVVEKAIGNVA